MKLTIEKRVEATIDTDIERKRIDECFKDNPDIHSKLTQLMDLIEAEKWQDAKELLEDSWWDNAKNSEGCFGREYIGLIHQEDTTYLNWGGNLDDYSSLVYWFANTDNYKVIDKSEKL